MKKNVFFIINCSIIFLTMLTLLFLCCSWEDFLDTENEQVIPAHKELTSVETLQSVTAGLYTQPWYYFHKRRFVYLGDARANNFCYTNTETNEYNAQASMNEDKESTSIQYGWSSLYNVITQADYIINDYAPYCVEQTVCTQEDANVCLGEARFMRSYNYWWLVEWFGDIEMRTKPTSTPVYTAYRTDRKVIYDEVIIPDAEAATKLLPIQPYNGEVGRSTKKAAYALLARVCLTRAQYETAGSSEARAFYQKAYDAAKYVMDNKGALGIKLYNTYDEIWQAKNNKTNTEFLWVVSHSSDASLNPNPKNPNRLHLYWAPRLTDRAGITTSGDSWEYPKESVLLMPTYYFLKLWKDWDIRYEVLFQEEFYENNRRGSYTWEQGMADNYNAVPELVGKTVDNDDVVLCFTKEAVTTEQKVAAANEGICLVGCNDTYDVGAVNAQGGCRIRSDIKTKYEAFPRFRKYRIWDRDPNGTILLQAANGNVGFADAPVMRYAEMPLIAAEAKIGLGDQAGAAQIINSEIRNARVVKPGHDLSEAQVTASDMTVEWILEERARELCGEWLRWFDLKRTGNLVNYIRQHNPAWDGNDVVDEHNNLWPIPTTFLDKLQNAEEFGQNPGYDPYVRSN